MNQPLRGIAHVLIHNAEFGVFNFKGGGMDQYQQLNNGQHKNDGQNGFVAPYLAELFLKQEYNCFH
jgi:hypothetical protein